MPAKSKQLIILLTILVNFSSNLKSDAKYEMIDI